MCCVLCFQTHFVVVCALMCTTVDASRTDKFTKCWVFFFLKIFFFQCPAYLPELLISCIFCFKVDKLHQSVDWVPFALLVMITTLYICLTACIILYYIKPDHTLPWYALHYLAYLNLVLFTWPKMNTAYEAPGQASRQNKYAQSKFCNLNTMCVNSFCLSREKRQFEQVCPV